MMMSLLISGNWRTAFGRMTHTELRAMLKQGDLLELCDEE